ncbi:TIGR03435 family protein [Terriglobus albidus]|uniref:TIGR03435 family protein n=1 Tax=Terriglobus albidus TaxID=1592106 RepID=A0A5B9EBS2_9BACT|nr:TIGR03435 family protein [Terriglobus albidus]QEE27476.1 TIGR03435 family protein [Terriglobus albidus]
MTRVPSLLVSMLALAAPLCIGQTSQPIADAKFEVVVIKPTPPGSTGNSLLFGQGKMTVHNMPLKDVIKFAYDLKSDSQLLNAPVWVNTDRYEIDAKEDEALSAELMKMGFEGRFTAVREIVRQMLVERFHLETTPQSAEVPIYALVVAKGGAKVTPTPPPTPGEQRNHGWQGRGPGNAEGSAITMDLVARVISNMPEADGRVVINKTNMSGEYDWKLHWTPQSNAATDASSAPAAEAGPTLFTALQEQLGLKLESQKDTVPAVAINHIERPTEN